MSTRSANWLNLAMCLLAFGYSLYLYPIMPDRVPIHWNIRGEVDGWGPKEVALFIMPGCMLFLFFLTMALPFVSPKGYDVETFRPTFNYVMALVTALEGYVHVVIVQGALHPHLDVGRWMTIGIFLLFGLMGNVLGRVKRNFYMGIRTPWTIASDAVWVATHRFGARVMVGTSVIGIIAVFAGIPMQLTIILLIGAALLPVAYSYFAYQRLEGGPKE
jgi:uncharacterized membrane protein